MEQAIKKAIEGGWGGFRDNKSGQLEFIEFYSDKYHFAYATQQSLFWQALGKAMQLEGSTYIWQRGDQEKWLTLWHHFIDHLAEGKDAESFFKELLK